MNTSLSTAPGAAQPVRSKWRRIVLGVLGALVLALLVFFAGPRNAFGPNVPTARPMPPQALGELDGWLKTSEQAFADIRPGTAKGIVWNGVPGQRTPWAVVYLHGFTASRLETAPVAETVAQALGANVFYTRLAGHGRSSEAMGEASVQDWLADATEALRIGQRLGERVLVISCSTGSTLASWLALTPEGAQVAAHVFISPNFGPKDKRTEIINGPWGQQIVGLIQGDSVGQPSDDLRENQAWTKRYPTRALFPMMALVKAVRESDLPAFKTPLLLLYSERDQTVDPELTKAAFARIGSPLKTLEAVDYSKSQGQHVLAGDIRAPEATAPMAASIVKWVTALPAAAR